MQVLPDAVVAVASGTNLRNLQIQAWQQADGAVLDAGTPILLVGGNPDLQAFFVNQEGAYGVFALPEDSVAIHEALLASNYESTLVELAGAHGSAVHPSSPEFPRHVELVVAAVETVR